MSPSKMAEAELRTRRLPYGTYSDGITQIFEADPARQLSSTEVAKMLSERYGTELPSKEIARAMSYLYKKGILIRVAMGVYQFGSFSEPLPVIPPEYTQRMMREGTAWAIMHLMAAEPQRWWRPVHICAELHAPKHQVTTALGTLSRAGKVERNAGFARLNKDIREAIKVGKPSKERAAEMAAAVEAVDIDPDEMKEYVRIQPPTQEGAEKIQEALLGILAGQLQAAQETLDIIQQTRGHGGSTDSNQ